jgi:polysaccharide biosynthesis/export protein
MGINFKQNLNRLLDCLGIFTTFFCCKYKFGTKECDVKRVQLRFAKGLLLVLTLMATSCSILPGMRYTQKVSTEIQTYTKDSTTIRLVPVPLAVSQAANQQMGVPQNAISSELLQVKSDHYKIGSFDILMVVVWEHPELTTPLGQFRSDNASGQVVSEDGTLYFPYAGKMKVAGLTTGEIRDMITAKLSEVLKDPQVDVKVMAFRSQRIYITGEVENPGIVAINDVPLTLGEALHRAGGLKTTADGGNVFLSRNGKMHQLDIIAMYEQGSQLNDIVLQHGDLIRVPGTNERKVYVMGEVLQPRAVVMNNGRLSLVQALAEAGGPNMLTADAGAIYVIRFAGANGIDVFHLNADNPLALAVGDQFALAPKDVIYVDPAGLVRWNRFINLILPTATLLNQGVVSTRNALDVRSSVND